MFRDYSQKFSQGSHIIKLSQHPVQNKRDLVQPTYNNRREFKNDYINNYLLDGNNSKYIKTDSSQKYSPNNNQKGSIYTTTSNYGRRNQGSQITKITVSKYNYGVINSKKNSSMSTSTTNSKDDGINKLRGKQTQISNYTQKANNIY